MLNRVLALRALRSSATAICLAALVLAGCGSGNGKDHNRPPDNGTLSGQDLGTRALIAVRTAQSFRIVGHSGEAAKSKFSIDVRYGKTSTQGVITLNGSSVELIRVGESTYLKAPDKFWSMQLGSTIAAILADRWVKVKASNALLKQMIAFGKRAAVIDQLGADVDSVMFSRGPRKTIEGASAVSYLNTSTGMTVFVRAVGTPYPILSEGGRQTGGAKTRFSAWNQPFIAPEPPADQVVDLATVVP